jgi:putative nucleotidyltransferase with HDIG domain
VQNDCRKALLIIIEIDEVYIAGLLHDVGKLSYSDTKFEKTNSFDDHGYLGRRMVEQVGLNKDILEGIEFHHVDYDLSNYEGDQFNEQPFYAQIIRVANDFDFLMNTAANVSDGIVIEKMLHASGKAYAPQFLRILNELSLTQNDKILRIYGCEVDDES